MPEQIIFGLVGKISSGKGTVAEYLNTKYNGTIYGFSTPLRDILKRLYLPIVRENMANLSSIIRKQFGNNLISKTITNDIKQDASKIIVLDGIRRMSDIEHVKALPSFIIIRIVADQKIRYERMTHRNQNKDDNTKTFEEFVKDEQAEADAEIPLVMAEAELEFNNNGTIDELHQQIDKVIHTKLK